MPLLLSLKMLPWKMIGLASIAFAVLALFAHDRMVVAQNVKLKAQIVKCNDGRKADRKSYEDAQKQAADKNKAEVARIEAEQQKVTNEIQSDLNARLERLRRELRQGAPAAPGSPGSPKAGPDGKAPGGTADSSGLCLTPDQLLRGAENEERHEQLIRWIENQLRVAR